MTKPSKTFSIYGIDTATGEALESGGLSELIAYLADLGYGASKLIDFILDGEATVLGVRYTFAEG